MIFIHDVSIHAIVFFAKDNSPQFCQKDKRFDHHKKAKPGLGQSSQTGQGADP
jgi:hypothetical protein